MGRISKPNLKNTVLNLSDLKLRKPPKTHKRVTINNVNMSKIKHTHDIPVNALKHIPDTELLKEAYNPGMMTTVAKRANGKGISIDVNTNDLSHVNSIRQVLKDSKVNVVDDAVKKWTTIDSDLFLTRKVKR